ncbi:8880_t:CDS:2 [Ambispora leptoticha]|uniref:8880_t:CDS:1 n=1 Tax=Ambispora leptoticha TaxID=144679 RepID=A0A9N9BMA7_9GLOM|nr:8880_t:CDS:2 [Ambispora leptoticha]
MEMKAFIHRQVPKLLEWPSYSPDLNPIENLWAIIKKRVEKRVNKIVQKEKSISISHWHGLIRKEWKDITVDLCLNLVKGMSSHVNESNE